MPVRGTTRALFNPTGLSEYLPRHLCHLLFCSNSFKKPPEPSQHQQENVLLLVQETNGSQLLVFQCNVRQSETGERVQHTSPNLSTLTTFHNFTDNIQAYQIPFLYYWWKHLLLRKQWVLSPSRPHLLLVHRRPGYEAIVAGLCKWPWPKPCTCSGSCSQPQRCFPSQSNYLHLVYRS